MSYTDSSDFSFLSKSPNANYTGDYDKENNSMRARKCECCDAKIVEYKHKFNKGLAIGLHRLAQRGGCEHLKQLKLSYDQHSNFQKLRYWGLVKQALSDKTGKPKKGYWKLTTKGELFLNGLDSISSAVWTYRGNPVRFDGEPCVFNDFAFIIEEYDELEDYADTAVPHYE